MERVARLSHPDANQKRDRPGSGGGGGLEHPRRRDDAIEIVRVRPSRTFDGSTASIPWRAARKRCKSFGRIARVQMNLERIVVNAKVMRSIKVVVRSSAKMDPIAQTDVV